MAFRRNFRRGRRGPRLPLRWSGNHHNAETAVGAATLDYVNLINVDDYRQQSTLEEAGCTLVRIRGYVSLRAAAASAAWLGIFHANENVVPTAAGVSDPTLFASFIDSGVLWIRSTLLAANEVQHFDIDVRVKRRLENDRVDIVLKTGGAAVSWLALGRCLIRGG